MCLYIIIVNPLLFLTVVYTAIVHNFVRFRRYENDNSKETSWQLTAGIFHCSEIPRHSLIIGTRSIRQSIAINRLVANVEWYSWYVLSTTSRLKHWRHEKCCVSTRCCDNRRNIHVRTSGLGRSILLFVVVVCVPAKWPLTRNESKRLCGNYGNRRR